VATNLKKFEPLSNAFNKKAKKMAKKIERGDKEEARIKKDYRLAQVWFLLYIGALLSLAALGVSSLIFGILLLLAGYFITSTIIFSLGAFPWLGACFFTLLFSNGYLWSVRTLFPGEQVKDDRLPGLRRMLGAIVAWDRDVKRMNRLIDEVDLGRLQEDEIRKMHDGLRTDEEFMHGTAERFNRLSDEGPLGSSVDLVEDSDKLIEQFDERIQRINDHRAELREYARRVEAAAEISRLK
jgi:hypothetical protein